VPSVGQAGFRERVFGLRNPLEDGSSSVFSYGWPVIETNAAGHSVLVYSRTGKTIDPEIRFSTWLTGEADIRPSRLLKAGEKPYKLGWAAKLGPLPWADTGGISVDPFDDDAVWFAHCYADSHAADNNYAIYVGKVFGKRWPWIRVAVYLAAVDPRKRRAAVRLAVSIANGGDGASPATEAVVRLAGGDRDALEVARLRVPPLAPGASSTAELQLPLSRDVQKGRFDLEVAVDPDGRIEQYDRAASTGRCRIQLADDD
jgi:hypothetical protein